MSLSSTTTRNSYTGNGAVDTYSYTFKILAQGDLVVTVKDTSDVETTLTIATDYTVTGVGSSAGGTVVLVNASQAWLDAEGDLKTSYVLTIRRVVDVIQGTDIRNQGDFYPEVHEDAFDYLTMIDQQQQDVLDRAVILSESNTSADFDPILPVALPGSLDKALVTNATGDGWDIGPSTTEIANAEGYAIAADASADLAALWATETTALVAATDNSAKAWAIGGTGAGQPTAGPAKDWATKTSADVDGSGYSAKEWALGTQTRGVASGGSSKDWANYTGATVDDTEYSAKKYATDAAASAASASTAAASSLWNDVAFKVFGDSPLTIVDANAGTLFAIDCTGGNVVVNLPSIAALTLSGSWSVGFKKTDTSSNTITINIDGTDTIDGASSKVISRADAGCTLIPDVDGSPDEWTSITYGEMPISGAVVGTTDTQVLSNKTFSDAATMAEIATPSTPASGYAKIYAKSDGNFYALNDSGIETAVGSGSGSGAKNYFSSAVNSGTATTGFSGYADAAGVAPVDGTGGSPSGDFAIASSATSPLSGTHSLVISKTAANLQGEGVSIDFTLDTSDKGKVLALSMNYAVASGTYADDDVVVYFYDVTNSALLQPAPYLIKNHSLTSDRFFCEVQTPYNCDTLRMIVHCSSTSASAYSLKIDDLLFGPQAKLYGSAVTDWVSYTPTISSGAGTISGTLTGKYRKVGDSLEVNLNYAYSSGTGAAADFAVSIPSGYTIDTAKLPTTPIFGSGYYYSTGTGFLSAEVRLNSTTSVQFTKDAVSAFWQGTDADAAGAAISADFRFPAVGLSSSQLLSSDASTRVVGFLAETNATTTVGTSNTIVAFGTMVNDTHGGYSTANKRYTIKVPGRYKFEAQGLVECAAAGGGSYVDLTLLKNGATSLSSSRTQSFTTSEYTTLHTKYEGDFVAGDYVEVYSAKGSATGTYYINAAAQFSKFIGTMIQGPAQIAASETVGAIANLQLPTGTLGASWNVTKFGTIATDYTGSYSTSTGLFTAPISGLYEVSANVELSCASISVNALMAIAIYANGSGVKYTAARAASASVVSYNVSISGTARVLAGQTIAIYAYNSGTTPAYSNAFAGSDLSITRVGNY